MSIFAIETLKLMYNFDEVIDRKNTGCIKYDYLAKTFGRDDVNPLWIADMDFRTPDFIVEALQQRLDHPIFGYPATPDDYFRTISEWVGNLHGWKVNPDHIRYIPGIVKGIAFAERCFLEKGDKVIIQPPVYHPFRNTTCACGFEVVENPLIPEYDGDGFLVGYKVDFAGLEHACADPRARMLVLSNPHNPCGIAWDLATLQAIADITSRNGVIVLSDEIHGEMVLNGERHLPFASVSAQAADSSIVFMAPSKTFNIAGIVSSYCIIENETLRDRFFKYIAACEIDFPSIFSTTATLAAYRYGLGWRNEMLSYVKGNIEFVDKWTRGHIPSVRVVRPQASFLVWLDCRKLGLSHDGLIDLFVNKAKLGLNDGAMFGAEGSGFMRLNVGCPRSILEKALDSLEKAINAK